MRGRPERRSLGLPLHRPLYTAVARRIGSNIPGHNRCEYIISDAGELASYVTFTRSSTATRFNSAGLLETVAANAPRYDYDPVTLQLRGLLIEEQRTNRMLNTEDFTAASWAATVAGTSTRTNSVGTRGFGLGVITATSASGGIRQSLTGLTSGWEHSLSFYMESASTSITIALENGLSSYGTACTVVIDATNGATSSQVGFTSATSVPLGGGRIYTLVLPAAGGSLIANIEWRLPNGASMKIGRPQFEQGAFATSYIPTTTAAVTRAADNASITNLANIGFNAAEGALFADYASSLGSSARPFTLSDGTINNQLWGRSGGGSSSYEVYTGGAFVAQFNPPTANAGPAKIAVAFKANDFAVSVNASAVGTDAAGAIAAYNRLTIGANFDSTSAHMNGHIRRLRYYPRRLTNAQLQALTA